MWKRPIFFRLIFLSILLTHSLATAQSTIDVTSSTEATKSVQRKTIYDSLNGIWWTFYFDGTGIKYSYSADGTTYENVGTLALTTSSFALTYREIGGTGYVFIASEANNYDIILRRGTLSASSISFSSAVTVFDGVSSADKYLDPTVALNDSNQVWVSAIHKKFGNVPGLFQAYVRQTTNAGDGDLSVLGAATPVGLHDNRITQALIMPKSGNDMWLLVSGADDKILGYAFNGTKWSRSDTGGGFDWFNLPPAATGNISAMTVLGSDLYIGGSFTNLAGIDEADYLARFDGSAFYAVGSGLNAPVSALAVSGTDLYAGGDFTTAGGVTGADRIAYWDGANWNALGSGLNNTVYAIAPSGSNIYVGGKFLDAGGNTSADRIAYWDGATWNNMGTGANTNDILDIAISGSNVYVGGFFGAVDGVANTQYVAMWDGANWNALGTGLSGGGVSEIEISGSDVYVGGSFTAAGGDSLADKIARWSGSTWNRVGGSGVDITGGVTALKIIDSVIYIGGSFSNGNAIPEADSIMKYEGSSWSAVGTGLSGGLNIIDEYNGEILLGGLGLSSSDNSSANGLVLFDGNTYASALPEVGTTNWIAVDGTDLYIVGSFVNFAGVTGATGIAKWDGSQWSALGAGLNDDAYTVIIANSKVYVGGQFTSAGGNTDAGSLAVWDGNTWSSIGLPNFGSDGVSSIAVDGNDVYVTGYFSSAAGVANTAGLAHWNGSAWSALGTGLNNAFEYAYVIKQIGTDIYIGGDFTSVGGVANTDAIARWDGANWHALASGFVGGGIVYSIESYDGKIVAGGSFTNAYADPNMDNIAIFDGSSWAALGTGLNNDVFNLYASGSSLFVGGSFTDVNSIAEADYLALWNGSAWSAVGEGPAGPVYNIALDGDNIWTSGNNLSNYSEFAVTDSDSTTDISVVRDSEENLLLTYSTSSDLRFRRYSLTDDSWESAISISTGSISSPNITVLPNDSLIVSWIDSNAVKYIGGKSESSAVNWESASATLYNTGTNFGLHSTESGTENRALLVWKNGNGAPYTLYGALVAKPGVVMVTSDNVDGHYRAGEVIDVNVVFSPDTVTVTGTPTLTLETGGTDRVASYVSGSGSSELVFRYTVQDSDTSSDLDYVDETSLALSGGTIISSTNSFSANLQLPTPGSSASLAGSKSLIIDTARPDTPILNGLIDNFQTSDLTPTFSGTGEVGASIQIFIDGTLAATATVGSDGTWSVELTSELSLGRHTISVKQFDQAGNESVETTEKIFVVTTSYGYVPFDFDHDGETDLVSSKKSAGSINFNVLYSSDASILDTSLGVSSSKAALGDYNADGTWELGVVTKGGDGVVTWEVRDSENGNISSEEFGASSDRLLIGCNFDSTPETEMAFMRDNQLFFKHFGSDATSTVTLPEALDEKYVRGCGDIDGDGVFEIFFQKKKKKKKKGKTVIVYLTTAYDTTGTEIFSATLPKFKSIFGVDASGDSLPEVGGYISDVKKGKFSIVFYDSSTGKKIKVFKLKNKRPFTIGQRLNSESVLSNTVTIHKAIGNNDVYYQFIHDKQKLPEAKLGSKHLLVPSTGVN